MNYFRVNEDIIVVYDTTKLESKVYSITALTAERNELVNYIRDNTMTDAKLLDGAKENYPFVNVDRLDKAKTKAQELNRLITQLNQIE